MNQNGRGPLAPVIKGIAAGVGLVSEYRHYRKEQHALKDRSTVSDIAVSDTSIDSSIQSPGPVAIEISKTETSDEHECDELTIDDEKHWDLDEAQDDLATCSTSEQSKPKVPHDPAKLVKQFTDAHPPKVDFADARIALPVILPQRRPKNRTRGFIRAYAPELEKCDIDEKTFIELIETFNAATLASPWLDAINLASLALVTLPTAISQAVSIAIAIAVDITKNMQSRYRHHYILDQLNDEYFRPRGLYALVLTWNPDSSAMKVDVNLNDKIADNLTKRENLFDKAKHNFSPSSGNTVGTAFSEAAPLVFPILDSLVHSETPEAKEFKQKVKNAKGLIGEYFDRRAQAEHAGEHPDSQLAVTKPVFTSRYSDPNHPSNNGDLLSLVTGGKLSRPPRGSLISQFAGGSYDGRFRGRGFSRFQQYGASYCDDPYRQHSYSYNQGRLNQPYMGGLGLGARNGLLAGGIKRVFQHHVLYLSIVNMPSDEELAEAKQYLKNTRGSSPAPEEARSHK